MKKTNDGSKTRTGRRLRTLAATLCAAWAFAAGGARAQQLWSVGEVSRAPGGPAVVMGGARVGPGPAGPLGLPAPAEAAEIRVTFDYLRLGMGYLELPLFDGSTIEAENAVFEDRGDGNLMWTGEVPGAGYESVLFTVQDGHLVGWFGEPGGRKYVVYAGPDGRGSLSVETGPVGDWCGVEEALGPGPAAAAAAAADRPRRAVSAAGDGSLDILVLYTTGTERYWRVIGGPKVGVRQLGDYLNMVFRNGEIPATANLIPVRWDPGLHNRPSTQGWHYRQGRFLDWHGEFEDNSEVARLRRRYEPDLIHFVPAIGVLGTAGRALLRTNLRPGVYTGWSTPFPRTFAHEIGHNLGGRHEPVTFSNFAKIQAHSVRPYSFGHTDMTSCAKREGRSESRLYCPRTIMSYGSDAYLDDDPNTWAIEEPFYSSVRHKPNGWTIGVAGTSEVERVFHETVPVAAASGKAPWSADPRRVTGARWLDRGTLRVSWSDDTRPHGGQVRLAMEEGANDTYYWAWDDESDWTTLHEASDANLKPVIEADGSSVGLDVSGLRPGGRYRIAVGRGNLGDVDTDVFHIEPPAPAAGAPAAPSNVGAQATGAASARLSWRDNANNEAAYEIWWRKWSGDEPDDEVWRRYGAALPAGARSADVRGLTAEEEIGVTDSHRDRRKRDRYSFVVVAFNDRGWSASETFDFEFLPGPHPAPTAVGDVSGCGLRPAGLDLDGFAVSACVETPDGARRRMWDYRLDSEQSGLLYVFDRDNVEVLVKVLDGCGVNGHRWVFVAPVTDLPFRLRIVEPGPYIEGRRMSWHYDSERRPQDRLPWLVGNPKGRTARTVSDTTAFPCTTAEVAAAKAAAAERHEFGRAGAPLPALADPARRLAAGASTACEPSGAALTLRGGYTVGLCWETQDGRVGAARDWGLDSSQSALLYFFDPDNVEVLIKVLDGCGVNGHRWVFVAPVTDLAFNLVVTSPGGEIWTHRNRLGRTADAASDVAAFPCASRA